MALLFAREAPAGMTGMAWHGVHFFPFTEVAGPATAVNQRNGDQSNHSTLYTYATMPLLTSQMTAASLVAFTRSYL